MGRSTRTTRSGGRGAAALVAVLTVLALVLAGCTGAADRPEPATEDTAEVGPDQTAELAFGQVQVQIPAGAVADDGTATLTTGTQPNDAALRDAGMAAASDLIGVELDGTQLTGRATITQQVPDDWPKSWRPVMVWENPAGGWQWLPTRVTAADGKRTAVAKTGHFSDGFLAAFDVRAAGEKAAKAFGEFITGRAGVENPKCEAEDEARETLKVSSDSGDAVKWCLGVEDGAHVLKVSNNRRTLAQLSLPLGTTVLSGAGWGISVANLVRAVGEGLEQFAAGFPSDRTMLLLRPGKTVTVQIPASSGGGAEITASGVGYLLSILVNAVDMYATIAGAAGLKPATNADTLWSFLGDGAGKGSNWAEATKACLRSMTDVYTDDFTQAVTTTQAIEKALQFAGTCGTEIGKASVEASGPLGWLASATAATVASIVGTVYSLIEQLFVGVREVVDAVRYGFGSGEDPIYTIRTGPLSSSLLNADGNGLGSWTFGEPAEDVLAGLTSVLDTPEVDTGWEQYQTLHGQDGYFADNDPIAERWDYAYFRATCWQALCVIFGGSSPEAAAFRGWELSKYQRWSGWTDVDINEPDIALAETGIKLGDTWADFSAAYPAAVVGTGEGMSPVIDNPPWDGIFDGVWSWRLELDSGYVDGDTPEVPPDTPVVRMSGGEGPEPGCC